MRFTASSRVKVKSCDFAALAQFTNTHGGSQYVKLEGVDWALTEVTKARVEQQVLTEAVQDAAAESLDLVPEDVELSATVHARFTAS